MATDAARVEEVHLLPLEALARPSADDVAARLSRRLSAGCRLVADLPAPPPVRLPDRDQVDADALLARLEARPTAEAAILVGLTTLDIAVPVFTFVFGRARQGARAVLVCLARLDPAFYGLPADPDLLLQRATLEVLHELGHAASLAHCPDASCLMSFAGSVERVDARGSSFCEACHERLPHGLRG